MSIEEEDEFRKNLVNFFKLFKDRPYHLANYLIDNFAFNKSFINKILMSDKLKSFKSNQRHIFMILLRWRTFLILLLMSRN
jgi:hypothetical protein